MPNYYPCIIWLYDFYPWLPLLGPWVTNCTLKTCLHFSIFLTFGILFACTRNILKIVMVILVKLFSHSRRQSINHLQNSLFYKTYHSKWKLWGIWLLLAIIRHKYGSSSWSWRYFFFLWFLPSWCKLNLFPDRLSKFLINSIRFIWWRRTT